MYRSVVTVGRHGDLTVRGFGVDDNLAKGNSLFAVAYDGNTKQVWVMRSDPHRFSRHEDRSYFSGLDRMQGEGDVEMAGEHMQGPMSFFGEKDGRCGRVVRFFTEKDGRSCRRVECERRGRSLSEGHKCNSAEFNSPQRKSREIISPPFLFFPAARKRGKGKAGAKGKAKAKGSGRGSAGSSSSGGKKDTFTNLPEVETHPLACIPDLALHLNNLNVPNKLYEEHPGLEVLEQGLQSSPTATASAPTTSPRTTTNASPTPSPGSSASPTATSPGQSPGQSAFASSRSAPESETPHPPTDRDEVHFNRVLLNGDVLHPNLPYVLEKKMPVLFGYGFGQCVMVVEGPPTAAANGIVPIASVPLPTGTATGGGPDLHVCLVGVHEVRMGMHPVWLCMCRSG